MASKNTDDEKKKELENETEQLIQTICSNLTGTWIKMSYIDGDECSPVDMVSIFKRYGKFTVWPTLVKRPLPPGLSWARIVGDHPDYDLCNAVISKIILPESGGQAFPTKLQVNGKNVRLTRNGRHGLICNQCAFEYGHLGSACIRHPKAHLVQNLGEYQQSYKIRQLYKQNPFNPEADKLHAKFFAHWAIAARNTYGMYDTGKNPIENDMFKNADVAVEYHNQMEFDLHRMIRGNAKRTRVYEDFTRREQFDSKKRAELRAKAPTEELRVEFTNGMYNYQRKTLREDMARACNKEGAPSKDAQYKTVPTKDAPRKDVPRKDVPRKDAPRKDVPRKDVPRKDAPPKDAPPKDVPPKDAPPKDVPPKDVPPKDVPPKDVPPKDVPRKDAPPKDAPPKDVQPEKEAVIKIIKASVPPKYVSPRKDISPKDISPKDISPKDISPKDISPKDISPKDISPNDISKNDEVQSAAGRVATNGIIQALQRDEFADLRSCLETQMRIINDCTSSIHDVCENRKECRQGTCRVAKSFKFLAAYDHRRDAVTIEEVDEYDTDDDAYCDDASDDNIDTNEDTGTTDGTEEIIKGFANLNVSPEPSKTPKNGSP